MYKLNSANRIALGKQVANVLNASDCLETVNLRMFSYYKDGGEDEFMLEALRNSPSLANITTFDCSYNYIWF